MAIVYNTHSSGVDRGICDKVVRYFTSQMKQNAAMEIKLDKGVITQTWQFNRVPIMPLVFQATGASGERQLCHQLGPGKYLPSVSGLNRMCGIIPFFHCADMSEKIS